MNSDRIRKLQIVQLCKRIVHHTILIKADGELSSLLVQCPDDAKIAIKDTASFFYRHSIIPLYFPFHLIIVAGLHHTVANTERLLMRCGLCTACCRRIQYTLQYFIETDASKRPLPHRSKHLYVIP